MSCLEGHRTNLGFDDKADRLATAVIDGRVVCRCGRFVFWQWVSWSRVWSSYLQVMVESSCGQFG